MPTARWWWGDPLSMLNELRNAQDLMRGRETGRAFAGVYPAVNIYDDGECFMLRAEVPGIDKFKLEVTSKGNEVSIRGERTFKLEEQAAFHRRERGAGVFHRVVTLPDLVDGSAIQAAYKNGVLEVICPRAAEAKPRRVTIS
jgi:HSP20 family protein